MLAILLAIIVGFCGTCSSKEMPFDYDLHIFSIPGSNGRTLISFHGYGGNYQLIESLKNLGEIDSTLVGFNFPDYDLEKRPYDPCKASFGTINELLPAIYVLKKTIIDKGLTFIDLYGRSAGGGALVNVISVLNTSTYDESLLQIGVDNAAKKKILSAIQNGIVILDVPLKSVDEIIDLRGSTPELESLTKNYKANCLRPIDSIKNLKGLKLNIILHFENPDEVIFNRDDALYIKRLKKANSKGTTTVLIGNEAGHRKPYLPLWEYYEKEIKN